MLRLPLNKEQKISLTHYAGLSKNAFDRVIRHFNAPSAGLKKRGGWIFAGPPLSAISRSNWSPESAKVRPPFQKRLVRMVPGSARGTGLQLMQFNNPTSTKNENKKYDNSTLKKINRPLAFGARFPSHRPRPRLVCAFAAGASGYPATRRRLSRLQHR